MKDTQYLADAEKMRIDISPLPGAKVQEIVQKLHATPKNIVQAARAAIRRLMPVSASDYRATESQALGSKSADCATCPAAFAQADAERRRRHVTDQVTSCIAECV